MNVTRIAVLGVAAVAGLGAFYLMMTNRPDAPQAVQVVEPSREKTVRVLVAAKDFQRGERLDVASTRWVAWPEKSVSASYLTETSGATPETLASTVARTLIIAGEPIVEAKIVRAGASGLMAAILEPGMRAVTQRVTAETASGGFILPGDRIDILYTDTRGNTSRTRTIFENVRVLAIDANYSEATEAANVPGATVTLEFTPDDAEAFITARSTGAVSLALRSVFQQDGDAVSSTRRSKDVNVIRYGRS